MTAQPKAPELPPVIRSDQSQLPTGDFRELNLPAAVIAGLNSLGYVGPTPVQRATFGPAMAGRDLIVQAKTGSGKTCAFGVPMITALEKPKGWVRGLVLCPTRELALQVATEVNAIAKPSGLKTLAIYGGAAFGPQRDALVDGIDMVVGTPGRILDHISRGTLELKGVQFMVLDEADEMLSMGFWDDVTDILKRITGRHQTMLFSATLPSAIERAARQFLHEPERVELSGDALTVSGITNACYNAVENLPKPRNLLYVLEVEKPESAIIFCNRRDETELIGRVLKRFGFRSGVINSDLSQNERERVMAAFKARKLQLLVATDVAARGIDIDDLSHVFNYDLPEFSEVYVHRAGRTGRIGKRGTAVSLVRGLSAGRLREISRLFGIDFEERELPPVERIMELQAERVFEQLKIEASGVELGQYQGLAAALLKSGDGATAVAYLLRSYFSEARETRVVDPSGAPADGSGGPTGNERPPRPHGGPRRGGPRRRSGGPR